MDDGHAAVARTLNVFDITVAGFLNANGSDAGVEDSVGNTFIVVPPSVQAHLRTADTEMVDISGGEIRDNCRRSARLVGRYEKSNGGDVRKVEIDIEGF